MMAPVHQWLGVVMMGLGASFMLIAALGVLRMPDLFTRMQAATKTGTAGAGCILIGTSIFMARFDVTTKALVVVVFLFLTAPVAAHMLARAGYLVGTPLDPRTHTDELAARFGRGPSVAGGTPSPKGEADRAASDRQPPLS